MNKCWLAGWMYEGNMDECFDINETLLHSVWFKNKIQRLLNSV